MKYPFKALFAFLIFSSACSLTYAQQIIDFEFSLYEERLFEYGRWLKQDISGDTIYFERLEYGPCGVDFQVSVKLIQSDDVVSLKFEDKNHVYEEGKLECGKMYKIKFKCVVLGLKKRPKAWALLNRNVPNDIWRDWLYANW